MNTNFYCRKLNQSAKDKLRIKIDKLHKDLVESIDDVIPSYNRIIDDFMCDNENLIGEIHLGKRSGGWQFLWDYHDGVYFQPTLYSIKEFLSQDGIVIYNEYGEVFTLEQFINEEAGPSLYKNENHTNESDDEFINWDDYYFTNDGLRFSKFEDFS